MSSTAFCFPRSSRGECNAVARCRGHGLSMLPTSFDASAGLGPVILADCPPAARNHLLPERELPPVGAPKVDCRSETTRGHRHEDTSTWKKGRLATLPSPSSAFSWLRCLRPAGAKARSPASSLHRSSLHPFSLRRRGLPRGQTIGPAGLGVETGQPRALSPEHPRPGTSPWFSLASSLAPPTG